MSEIFDIATLEKMGNLIIKEKANGFANVIIVKTPDGDIELTRMKVPSSLSDKMLKASASDDKGKIFDVISDALGYMIVDKEMSEKIQTNQCDFVTKNIVTICSASLLLQMGGLNL